MPLKEVSHRGPEAKYQVSLMPIAPMWEKGILLGWQQSFAQKWSSPKEDYAERLVGNMRGIIDRELLPTDCANTADLYCQQLDPVAAKLQKYDRVHEFTWQRQTSHCKVEAWKITEGRNGYSSTSTFLSKVGPQEQPFVSFSLDPFRPDKVPRREWPQNGARRLLRPKAPG